MNKIIHGDCIEEMKKLPENSVDAIITDPPYGLEFMGKDWDRGVPGINFWKEMIRVLKPGGYLLSFGGTRTYHRMVCEIEDAGFEIRDTIMWLYGSGFPKSLNIGKQIDKLNGKKQEEFIALGKYIKEQRLKLGLAQSEISKNFPSRTGGLTGCVSNWEKGCNVPTKEQWIILKEKLELDNKFDYIVEREEAEREVIGKDGRGELKEDMFFSQNIEKAKEQGKSIGYGKWDITKAELPEAKEWEGWGTALKPACEPIVVARKPLSEKNVALNVLKWGTGGINIDACRIGTEMIRSSGDKKSLQVWKENDGRTPKDLNLIENTPHWNQGRFPANIILDEEAGRLLDEQSGTLTSGAMNGTYKGSYTFLNEGIIYGRNKNNQIRYKSEGGASRFFYCAKSSKAERNKGITSTTIKLIKPNDIDILWKEENMELAQLVLKDILGLTESLNIEECGENIMVMCQKDSLSTIKMEINKITELKTWNSLTHLLTKEYIQDVFSKKENGGKNAKFVENLNQLMMRTGISQEKVGLVMEDVKNAIYKLLLILKENKENWKEDKCSHPTVKPIALMEYLIKLVSKEGATILDPFLGSGTTAIACLKLNRKFMGIEKEEEYVKIANARIKPFLEQRKLE